MGFIGWLLNMLFGKKGQESEVSLQQAQRLLRGELEEEEKELALLASKNFSQVKHLLSRLSAKAGVLESEKIDLKEGNEAFRKIVSTSQKNLARQLKGLSGRISPPALITADSARGYSLRAMNAISNDLMPYWKNIALAKLLLKDQVREIGENLSELASSVQQVQSKASGQRATKLRELSTDAGATSSLVLQSDSIKGEVSSAEKALQSAKEGHALAKQELDRAMSSQQAREIAGLEAEIAGIEKKKKEVISGFNDMIAPIERIIKRMNALAKDGGVLSPLEQNVLGLLLTSPESAIASDPKGEAFRSILSKASELVAGGSIALKEGEKDKKFSALASAMSRDVFSEFFWEINKLQASALRAQKELSGLLENSSVKVAQRKVEQAESSLQKAQESLARLGKKHAEIQKTVHDAEMAFASKFNSFFEGKYSLRS